MALSQFNRAYNSFSGIDIKAVFGTKAVGDLQAVSYSITREKAPIYTMGSADPRSFSRCKRGIAGTLIFIVFDRHGLLHLMGPENEGGAGALFLADKDDLKPMFQGDLNNIAPDANNIAGVANDNVGSSTTVFGAESPINTVSGDQIAAHAWFSDQIPPFDITLAANNEYGASAKMAIFGVEILNEGSGFSIDDIVIEQQMTYVCRTLHPWTFVNLNTNIGQPGTRGAVE